MTPGVRSGNLRWRTRHPQRSQIIPLAESAKIRCKSKFPLSFAPSKSHCHAVNPLAMATGAVSASARRYSMRPSPSLDPEQIKRHTDDEQGDRKMNDYRVLRVFRKQGSF
jgi:hypothetical protein